MNINNHQLDVSTVSLSESLRKDSEAASPLSSCSLWFSIESRACQRSCIKHFSFCLVMNDLHLSPHSVFGSFPLSETKWKAETMSTKEEEEPSCLSSQSCLQLNMSMWPTRHTVRLLSKEKQGLVHIREGAAAVATSRAPPPALPECRQQGSLSAADRSSRDRICGRFWMWPGIPVPDISPGLVLLSYQQFCELPIVFQ